MISAAPLRVALLGASGTIGRATARSLIARGYKVVRFLRTRSHAEQSLQGAEIRWCDASDAESLRLHGFANGRFDAVISCMASRTGAPQDAWRVDYQANLHALQLAKELGVKHFVMLSAICVQKPLLAFQSQRGIMR